MGLGYMLMAQRDRVEDIGKGLPYALSTSLNFALLTMLSLP